MVKRRVHGDRFPTLEELEIFNSEKHKTRSLNTVHIVTNVFSDAPPPSLRTLVLRDVLYLSDPSFLRNLAHVDIYNDLDHDFNLSWSMMTFRPMLEGMRHLEFLRLANAFPLTITAHEAAIMHEFEPIRLPSSLRDLVLVGPALSTEHFIACLDIPRTTRVDVRLAADQTHVYAPGDPDPYASELFLPLDTLRSLNGPRAPRRVAVTVDGGVPELGLRLWGESAVGKDILDETSADVALVLRGKDQVFDIGTVSRMEQGLSDALELDAVTELVCLGRREDPADPTTSGHREDWFGLLHLVPNVRLVCTRSPLSVIYILSWLSAGAAVLCPALETLVLVDALGADEGMRRKTLAFVSTCVGDRKRAGKPLKKVQIGVRDRGRVISRWEAKELSSIRKLGVEIEIVVCEAAEEG
ncbi:hypothetical protein OF83DRAFT_892238 [Amylostereum chailletii]|nr:hypothetical protein OF83DRAFT_892238 [Amylostereum chailletii]